MAAFRHGGRQVDDAQPEAVARSASAEGARRGQPRDERVVEGHPIGGAAHEVEVDEPLGERQPGSDVGGEEEEDADLPLGSSVGPARRAVEVRGAHVLAVAGGPQQACRLAVAAALGAVDEQAGAVLAAAHDLPGTGGGGRSGEVVPPVRLVRARRRGLQGRRIGERPHLRRRGEVRAPPEARAQHRARHPVAEATVDHVLRRLEHGQRASLLVAGPPQVVAHDGGEHPAPPVVGVHPDPRQPLRGTKGGPLASRSRHGDLDVPGPGGARRLSPAGGDEARSLRGVAQLCLARSARAIGPDEGVELEQGLDLALVGRVDAGDRDVARHEVTLAPGRRARQRLFWSSLTAPVRREATR